jgi:PAS domain S-box-containing protein
MSRRFAAFFGNLSLRSKGFLVVLIPTTAILLAMAMFYQYGERMRAAQEWVNHSYEVASEIRQLNNLVMGAEAGIRGYLLTRKPSSLHLYEEARTEIPARLVALRALVRDNPGQTAQLGTVENLVNANIELLDRLQHAAPTETPAGVSALLESSSRSMLQLRSLLDNMQSEERGVLAERTAAAQRAEDRLRLTVIGGGLIGLLGGVLAALFFATAIENRIKRVEKEARQLAEGRPIEAVVKGGDEIARLESTLLETSRLLAAQSEQLREAQSELEAKIQQRTSQLRQANENLRQANEVRTAIIGSSPLAIWAVGPGGTVIFWNPAAERIFGWTEAEVIGRPLPVIPEELRAEYAGWLERFQDGETLSGVERERVRKDGSRIQVEIWTAPLRDASGKISGTIAIDSDVTGRKLLEEQFRQSQRLEAVGRLAGGVAHDFNNLLTVICGYTETLIEESQDRPDLVEYAREIQYAGDRATSLTAQLLAFGRRQIIQPRILDLNEVVTRSINLVQRVIGEDIEVVTILAPCMCRVMADPGHIDQVIMNLVVNARDAMADGGRLTIETAETLLDENYSDRHIGVAPGRYCMLAISDNGTGMSSEVKTRLFEPFFTTKPVGKGTGLGLSIVYGIVKQNGGEVSVYSELGKGTTFKIYLPVVAATGAEEQAAHPSAEAQGSETILVCEDEEHIRRLVVTVLQKLGYRVLAAGDPKEALRIARDFGSRIHLLLTDVVMPISNGLELAATLRRARPDLKVLYMSGYADHHLAGSRILEKGMPFLQKPFAASTLAKKVREALAYVSGESTADLKA